MMMQFYVSSDRKKLSCQLYQRSADVFLGVPFNIASYALFTHMIAAAVGLEAGEFIHTLGDAHIYKDHFDQVKLQLSRKPLKLAQLQLNPDIKSLYDFQYEDIQLIDYQSYDAIKGKVSV